MGTLFFSKKTQVFHLLFVQKIKKYQDVFQERSRDFFLCMWR